MLIKQNVAFAMMRLQPVHNGHFNLIVKMLKENDIVIIGMGSSQISGTFDNIFSNNQKTILLKMLLGDGAIGRYGKIKLVPIEDIGAVNPEHWVEHCLDRIVEKNLPLPNRYYAGSDMDINWFKPYSRDNININKNRKYKDVILDLFVLDRHTFSINSSGTEIRKNIANNFEDWKKDVPECLHNYILENFPKKFMLNYNIDKKNINYVINEEF